MLGILRSFTSSQKQDESSQVHDAFQSLINLPRPMDAFSALSQASRCKSEDLRQNNVLIFSQIHNLPKFAGIGRFLHAGSFIPHELRMRGQSLSIETAHFKGVSVVFASLTSPNPAMQEIHAIVRAGVPTRLSLVTFQAAKGDCEPQAIAERIGRVSFPRAVEKHLISQA